MTVIPSARYPDLVGKVAFVTGSSRGIGFAAAKAGVVMLTRHLAQELGPKGIRANGVAPGAILTEDSTLTRSDPLSGLRKRLVGNRRHPRYLRRTRHCVRKTRKTTMSQSNDTISLLEKLGQDLAAAELHGDTSFLDKVLTEDFLGIGPFGFMLTKDQWLARYTSGDLKHSAFTWNEVAVRVYGNDAAIMTGRQRQESTHQGREIRGTFRATLIFVRQEEEWRLAGVQLSPMP